eukprot:g11193.t1
MLSVTLAKRMSWREGGQRAAARLAPKATLTTTTTTRGAVATRRRGSCIASTNDASAASSTRRRRGACPMLKTTAAALRTTGDASRQWTMATASSGRGYSGFRPSSGGGGDWSSRRPLRSFGTTKPPTIDGDQAAAAAAAAGAGAPGPGLEKGEEKALNGSTSSSGDEAGEEHQQQEEGRQTRKRRPGANRRRVRHAFGEPLSLLDDGGDAPSGVAADDSSSGGIDAEDELPDPELIEVDRAGDQQAVSDAHDPRARVTAARPEVVHALSRGLTVSRQVSDNLCSYATGERPTDITLGQLEKLLHQQPHQAEWAMSLIRAHLSDAQKPSAETHREHLTYVREMNTKQVSVEDMAEVLLRAHARRRWGPDMSREKLITDHPERWEEAISLSAKLADRLPVCRHQLLCKTLSNYLEAAKTSRRARFLQDISTVLRTSKHLVLPALTKFWRVKSIHKKLRDDIDAAKQQYLEDQALLARWLLFARRKSFPTVTEFSGPWSIEELHSLGQEGETEDGNEAGQAHGFHGGGGGDDDDDDMDFDVDDFDDLLGDDDEDGERRRKKKLDAAAVKFVSKALPPQVPKIKPSPPLGMFDLFVIERPRAMSQPPPRDIFGGDTPMGIGEAGMKEAPEWHGRDEGATKGLKVGEEYAWPEEKEEEEEEEARKKKEEEGRPWWEGAGKKELPRDRARDYQEAEEILRTGRRVHRPPLVTMDDIDKDLSAIAIKTQLQARAALVAELHPDKTRQIELQLQEEGSRTIFVNGLPYGLSPWAVRDAFSRCGPVHQVMIREPTFRDAEGGSPPPRSPLSSIRDKRTKAKPKPKPRRGFGPKLHNDFATSTPHGLVVFKDHEGFERATAESFRIFGVVIDGVAVTTKPAHHCRTLYVENFEMRTGEQMTDAINAVLEPQYSVGLKTHFLDDETPQVVAIPLQSYAAVRGVDTLLTDAGFKTTFHYTVPKARGVKPGESDLFPDPSKVKRAPGDERPAEEILFDEFMAFSKELEDIRDGGASSRPSVGDSLASKQR